MTGKHFIPRLLWLSCIALIVAACTQTSSASISSNSSASPTAQSATLTPLQQRPLHLPNLTPGTACPTSPLKKIRPEFGIAQGTDPAYATIGAENISSPAILLYTDAQHFGQQGSSVDNHGWGGQKVLWFVKPSYQGSVLIRGKQLNGLHQIRFNASLDQQLMLDTTSGGTPWPNFPSYTRIQAPGCYAYQVDGDNFSYSIVFRAEVQK